jgi:prostaglandin-endoperoxide synthase 2
MFAISEKAERWLFNIICATIGTIMFYRGVIAFMWHDYPVWHALGLVFFGGVAGIVMMHFRMKLGFWIFVVLDFTVGYVFIFILQDLWYDHVAPHILYAAVFVPFYRDMQWSWPFASKQASDPPVAPRAP